MADTKRQQFNNLQMVEIKMGVRHHEDTTIYQNPILEPAQMREIRLGLENGLEVEKYAQTRYSAQQMEQVRLGMKMGLDIKAFESPTMTADQMKEILESLLRTTKLYVHFSNKEVETILSPKISEMLAQRSEEVLKEQIAEQEAQKEPESIEEVVEEASEAIKQPEVQEEILTDQTIGQAQELVDEQVTEQQTQPTKEGEKEGEPTKEEKSQIEDPQKEEVTEIQYHGDPELNEAMKNYVLCREESGQSLLQSQIGVTLAHVAFLESDVHRQAEMLNQSVVNGWKSIYSIKDQSQGKAVPQKNNYQKLYSKPNQFHNFKEREYDYDKVNQKLLEQQWQPAELSGAQKKPAIDLEP